MIDFLKPTRYFQNGVEKKTLLSTMSGKSTSSSLSSSTKEKRKRRERTSADDDDDDDGGGGGGGGRDVVVGVGVGVVPPERRPPRRPLFLLLPGRAGRRGRGGGLETAAMRTPAGARTTAKPRGWGER